jgi:hypothetical protein
VRDLSLDLQRNNLKPHPQFLRGRLPWPLTLPFNFCDGLQNFLLVLINKLPPTGDSARSVTHLR